MKNNKWLLFLGVGSFLLTLLVYPKLPQQIPIHWSSAGEVDNYGPRFLSLILGAVPIGLYYMMIFLPRIDPKRENYAKHSGAYKVMQSAIIVFFILVHWLTMAIPLGYDLNISRIITIGIGILFVIIGNYMTRIRHNYFVGIKTPWTLANEEVWRKTHRMGGLTFVMAGLLLGLSTFLPAGLTGPFIAVVIIGMVGGLYGYSYLLYRKIVQK